MIRLASSSDAADIARIYNEAIAEGWFTGDLVPVSVESRQAWLAEHQDRYAVFVCELNEIAVGYVAISPYRKGRGAFSTTCEIAYYVARANRGDGIGKALIAHAIDYAAKRGFLVVVAIILGCNTRSLSLLEKYAFFESGRIRDAANIQNQLIDHVYMSPHLGVQSEN